MHAQLILQIKTVKPGAEANRAEPIASTSGHSQSVVEPIVISDSDDNDNVLRENHAQPDAQIVKQVNFLLHFIFL